MTIIIIQKGHRHPPRLSCSAGDAMATSEVEHFL